MIRRSRREETLRGIKCLHGSFSAVGGINGRRNLKLYPVYLSSHSTITRTPHFVSCPPPEPPLKSPPPSPTRLEFARYSRQNNERRTSTTSNLCQDSIEFDEHISFLLPHGLLQSHHRHDHHQHQQSFITTTTSTGRAPLLVADH